MSEIMTKDYISIEELAVQLNVGTLTIKRMIAKGDLPAFTYGSGTNDKIKGWHRKALEAHAVNRVTGNQ